MPPLLGEVGGGLDAGRVAEVLGEVLGAVLAAREGPDPAGDAGRDPWQQTLHAARHALVGVGGCASGFRLGCPVSTAALELSVQSERVRDVLTAHALSVGYDEQAARARAKLVPAAFERALLLARAARDGDVLRRTATSLVRPRAPR